MAEQTFSMLTAAVALARAVSGALSATESATPAAGRTVHHSTILATAAELDETLQPVVRHTARQVRRSSESLAALLTAVHAATALARLALEAVGHAHAHELHNTPIPGPAAAMLLRALWFEGATWDDDVVQVCGSFCSFADLVEVAGRDDALGISTANLPAPVSHAVAVCLTKNVRTAITDVRAATTAAVG